MKNKKKNAAGPTGDRCCTVTGVVSVDGRGQIVLPKDLRDQAGIKAGDKLAVVALGEPRETCCLMLLKTNELNGMVKIKIDAVLGKKAKGA
jgi:AbrB family looped-hinge helix DNA binding protein